MGFYGFNDSAWSVIELSVAQTDVRLPVLNVNYTNLMILDSSFNSLESIDDIGNETFPALRLFNLSHNAITNIKSHIFSHLKEVEILDLSHNCFVKIHASLAFLHHENLKSLYLHDNLLHSFIFDLSAPKTMTLDLLDVSNNFLNEFVNFEVEIKHLKIRNNSLVSVVLFHANEMVINAQNNEIIHFTAPSGSFNLLNLSNNKIPFISYVEVKEAKVLDLSYNKLETWNQDETYSDWDSFDNFYDSFERIATFDKAAMRKLIQEPTGIKTEFLSLASNNISSVHELRHFKNCLELNLDSNNLKDIDFEDFRTIFPMLKRVVLTNNPLTKVDETELKFFNGTRLLQLHFDYEISTEAPKVSTLIPNLPPLILPTLPPLFPLIVTTSKIIKPIDTTISRWPQTEPTTQTKSIIATTETHPTESDKTAKPDDEKLFPFALFAVVFAVIIVSSITFLVYRKQKRRVCFVSQSYNEAENYF